MTIEIDEATGLAELPEGYYFQVVEDELWGMNLKLKRKRKRWFDACLNAEIVYYAAVGTAEERLALIRESIEEASKKLAAWLQAQPYENLETKKFREGYSALIGKYPPKSLND